MRIAPVVPGVTLALALAGCGTPARGAAPRGAAPRAVEDVPLTRTEWRLVELTRDGGVPVAVTVESTLRFDGAGFAAHACNYVHGGATVDGTEIDFAGTRVSTQMGCHGAEQAVQDAFHAVAHGRVTWEVDGSRLWLRAPGRGTLAYEARDNDAYPTAGAYSVLTGERNGWRYRLAATGGTVVDALVFETRPAPGEVWRTATVAAPSADERAMGMLATGEIAAERFVVGFAPPGTVRVTHEPAPGRAVVTLTVRADVPGARWPVFGGFVAEHSRASTITAYAADGRVLESWPDR